MKSPDRVMAALKSGAKANASPPFGAGKYKVGLITTYYYPRYKRFFFALNGCRSTQTKIRRWLARGGSQ